MPWHIHAFPSASSTNTLTRDYILSAWTAGESPDRHIFLADQQTAGRGQHDRRWESPPGGLYFSAIVDDSARTIPPEIHSRMALLAGVATAEALRAFVPPAMVQLRWPNDLVAPGQPLLKVGGILCEGVALGDHYAAIIGIGINLNTPAAALPETLRPFAASLLSLDGHPRDRHAILQCILKQLDATLAVIRAQNSLASIVQRFAALDALRNRKVTMQTPSGVVSGLARSLTQAGDLQLETPTGTATANQATLLAIEDQPLRR